MITDIFAAIVILGAEKVWVLSSQVSDRQTDTLLQLREVWYVIMDILVKQLPGVYTICLRSLSISHWFSVKIGRFQDCFISEITEL